MNECRQGLYWNIEKNYCDFPEEANCVRPLPEDWEPSPTSPRVEQTTIDPADLPDGCPSEDEDDQNPTHLPHPTDCTKFFKCDRGIPVQLDCPNGNHWSIESDLCDYPEEANCIRPIV